MSSRSVFAMPVFRVMFVSLMAFSVFAVQAQGHVEKRGPYVVRTSSVSTLNLPEESAQQYGIERSAERAVVNVLVQREGQDNVPQTIPAEVHVEVRTLSGTVQKVDMNENWVGGYVSYFGVYTYLPRAVLDITVTATPKGSDEPISVTYRERMWARQ